MRQKRSITEVKEKEAQFKRQKRIDPKVKEMEAEWKRVRCQDTLYKIKKQFKTHYKNKVHPKILTKF